MKKIFLLIIALSVAGPMAAVAQNADEEVLKKVVRSETENYLKGDTAAWKALFTQDENTTRIFTGRRFYDSSIGWNNFGPTLVKWMEATPGPSKYSIIKNSNYIIKQSDNLAWLVYDQQISSTDVTLPASATREFRTLVKENQQWKISSIMTIDTLSFSTTRPQYIEDLFNATGYNFMAEKKTNEAIEIFKLNVKLYPEAWNTYDSLGEAYAAAGNKKLAIENYEKSIKLNPKNETGIAILAKLKKE